MSTEGVDWRIVPAEPGCYLFSDEGGRVIYIGKARNLKKRVASYFQKKDLDAKTAALVRRISALDFIVTANEVEALVLENTLIKKHQPRYNINLKDAKQYAFIHVTDEPFPRLTIARRATGPGFYGPFVSANQRDHVLRELVRIFRLRTCRRMPKTTCLRFHIGLCPAPCQGRADAVEYAAAVRAAVGVLKGDTGAVLAELRESMARFSREQNYEDALRLRDRIAALERLSERQNVQRPQAASEDILHYAERDGRLYLLLFHVLRGTLQEKQEFVFDDPQQAVEEFLARYYADQPPPRELILPRRPPAALQEYLHRLGVQRITVPQRGAKRQLLDLVALNIDHTFFAGDRKMHELQQRLGLPELPEVVECFDISHLAGSAVVGSMVQFRHGRPDKSRYRRFRIKTVSGIDDFAAIAEVVGRRYRRTLAENGELPDLILIDGGAGQLSAALQELRALGLTVPVISLAKRLEEVYLPDGDQPRQWEAKDPARLFLQEIRDEAHRFAVTYNRLLRVNKFREDKKRKNQSESNSLHGKFANPMDRTKHP